MHIAVIDDGIYEKCYNIGNLIHNIEITPELNILQRDSYDLLRHSHGTTCAAIIKKYDQEARFSSIRIINDGYTRGMQQQLVTAIDWCIGHDIKLINLSLGTTDYRDMEGLKLCINHAAGKGGIIIAACANKDIVTYPASFTNVIGVKCNHFKDSDETEICYFDAPMDGIDIMTCGKHCIMDSLGHEVVTQPSNSYAVPYITAVAAQILREHPGEDINFIKERLRQTNALRNERKAATLIYRKIDWIENAIWFHLGTKSYDITRFKNPMFHIAKIVEVRSDRLEIGIREAMNWVLESEYSSEIDTLILDAEAADHNCSRDIFSGFIKTLHLCHKQLVFLQEQIGRELSSAFEERPTGLKIWHADMLQGYEPTFPEDHDVQVPVIGVFAQNEWNPFPVLANLRRRFAQDGYDALTASEGVMDVIGGAIYIHPQENRDLYRYIAALNRAYAPDLMILAQKEDKWNGGYSFDIRIWVEIEGNVRTMKGFAPGGDLAGDFHLIIRKDRADLERIDQLYSWILKLLKPE